MKHKLINNIDSVIRDIKKGEFASRKKAARHLVVVMKRKVSNRGVSSPGSPPGRDSGDLRRGIGAVHEKDLSKIGAGPPAYHAHWFEFGTKARWVLTRNGKRLSKPIYVGRILPRPFVFPTFDEEADTVESIMYESWF